MNLSSSRSHSRFRLPATVVCAALAAATLQVSGATLLYSNNFESPVGFVDTTGLDVSLQPVNSLYGRPGFLFQQRNTVETLELKGGVAWGTGYQDPEGNGGSYAIGMLATAQDDWLSLTFNAGTFDFLNVGMDITAVDLAGVGGPFGVAQPIFRISLYNSPGGVFNINVPGTLLDTVDVTGTGTPHRQILDWTSVIAGLDASASTDGNVSMVIDLRQSGYAAFDNLVVVASDTEGSLETSSVPEPSTYAAGLAVLGAVGGAWWRNRRRA